MSLFCYLSGTVRYNHLNTVNVVCAVFFLWRVPVPRNLNSTLNACVRKDFLTKPIFITVFDFSLTCYNFLKMKLYKHTENFK